MKLGAFKDCILADDLQKKIELVKYNAREKGLKKEDWFRVDDSSLPNLRYTLTVSKRGYVYLNFFTYQVGNLFGLALGRAGSDEVESVVKPKYYNFYIIHTLVWAAQNVNGSFDIFIHGKLKLTDVIEYDLIGFDSCFTLLRIETINERYLVCIDVSDFVHGLYSPVDIDDFKRHWLDRILKYGYSGHLDGYPISGVVNVYYQAQSLFFGDGKYKQLDISVE